MLNLYYNLRVMTAPFYVLFILLAYSSQASAGNDGERNEFQANQDWRHAGDSRNYLPGKQQAIYTDKYKYERTPRYEPRHDGYATSQRYYRRIPRFQSSNHRAYGHYHDRQYCEADHRRHHAHGLPVFEIIFLDFLLNH